MNYLAHAYLSFHHREILVGNMISDFVKGNKKFLYSPGIQKGIALHRGIDAFTDKHAATKQAKLLLKPAAGPYAPAFADVVYDHFLATDETIFPPGELEVFAIYTYNILFTCREQLPERFQYMLPYMQRDNWLLNYRTHYGVQKSFDGLARRAKYFDDSNPVFELFLQRYDELKKCYYIFFPEVKQYAEKECKRLLQ